MGFRDYYRQFEDIDQVALNRERRARRARERKLALERVPDLDLSGTEWPDLPHSEIVNAAIARARGRVNGYPDRHATGARRLLADRHGIAPEKIVLGNGAAELLQAAAMALLSQGDELLMPWPSYPLYPLMAAHAYARPHPCERATLLAEVTERTRAVVVCNPNDPTGEYIPSEELGALLAAAARARPRAPRRGARPLPGRRGARRLSAARRCLPAPARGAHVLQGLRAVGAACRLRGVERRLAARGGRAGARRQRPDAGRGRARAASGDAEIDRRRRAVSRERARLLEALRAMPLDVSASQANFIWMAARGMSGDQLAGSLRRHGVIVAPGGPLGADDHIRATVRDAAATDRLLRALELTVGRGPTSA